MSDDLLDDPKFQNLFDKWLNEHVDDAKKKGMNPDDFSQENLEAVNRYHERLKNGFTLLFVEFNLI